MPSTQLMDKPYYHATLFTFLHSTFHYITSANALKNQGVEYTTPTRMAHTFPSLVLYFRWNTHMTTFSATVVWANHVKTSLTKLSLHLHGLQIWSHFPSIHQQLLLLIILNLHMLSYQMKFLYALNLPSLSLHTFNR